MELSNEYWISVTLVAALLEPLLPLVAEILTVPEPSSDIVTVGFPGLL